MPFDIVWEPPDGVYRRYHGDVTIAERRLSFDTICGDSRFDTLHYALTDYLSVQRYEITPLATAEIAALHIGPNRTNRKLVIVAVAVRPDVLEAIAEFKQLAFTDTPYEVFPTLDEARRWIAAVRGKERPNPPARRVPPKPRGG